MFPEFFAAVCLAAPFLPSSQEAAPAEAPVRVACIGDSVTFGAGLAFRERFSYPARLQHRLGDGFEVRNFGVNSLTLRGGADLPYVADEIFTRAVAWAPDIAIVMLGSNDVNKSEARPNWIDGYDFEPDVDAIAHRLIDANAGVRILLSTPPLVAPDPSSLNARLEKEVLNRNLRLIELSTDLRRISRQDNHVEFVDLMRTLEARDLGDGIHPNPFGAERIALRFTTLVEAAQEPSTRLDAETDGDPISSYFGFAETRYNGGLRIVVPERAVAGLPCIVALDPGLEVNALFRDLLDRGLLVARVPEDTSAVRTQLLEELAPIGIPRLVRAGTLNPVLSRHAREAELRRLLMAAGIVNDESDPTVRPRSAVEYRGGAGWGEDSTWWHAAESLRGLAEDTGHADIVFFGDSITQGLTGHTERRSKPDGERPFDAFARGISAVSLGLSGDRTEHLLYRLKSGALDPFTPRVIVLQIGVNNVNAAGHTADETARGIVAVVEALRARFPAAHIVNCGPFAAGVDPKSRVRRATDDVHARLAVRNWPERVLHVDLRELFTGAEGALLPTMSGDGIHVTGEGQRAWLDALHPIVTQLLAGD